MRRTSGSPKAIIWLVLLVLGFLLIMNGSAGRLLTLTAVLLALGIVAIGTAYFLYERRTRQTRSSASRYKERRRKHGSF
jgi:drug/metabolite transporter (DMT)-like permease